jgi:hypothetical protein
MQTVRSKLLGSGAAGSGQQSKYFLVVAFPYTPMLNGRSGDTDAYLLARFCAEGDVAAIKSLLDRQDLDATEMLKVGCKGGVLRERERERQHL